MIGTPSASPALTRTGHGVWKHIGGRSFTNTLLLFVYNPATSAFAGTQRVTRNIDLAEGSDEFTSTDSFETTDPNGIVTASGCVTGIGQRLE
jgi:hypothetical protein